MTLEEALRIANTQACPMPALGGEALRVLAGALAARDAIAILAPPDDTVSVPSDAMIEAACDALTESGGALWEELAYEDRTAFRPRMCAALIAAHLESLK